VPEEVRIRVFTIAGRKINELVRDAGSLRVGYNRVYWDGRDADGDEIANGYYLYEVLVKSNGRTESSIQKLAKVR
jgi:flagellar hook assembly protein FlgD